MDNVAQIRHEVASMNGPETLEAAISCLARVQPPPYIYETAPDRFARAIIWPTKYVTN